MNIYQKINAIRKEVAYIQKDKTVQNYKAVSHDFVVAICREHFVTQGVIVYPEQTAGVMGAQGVKPSKDGNSTVPDPMRLYEGGYIIHFVNADDPADRLSVAIQAHANDNGDKAPGKAVTYATKSAILKVLMLETGENEESRAPQKLEPMDEEQQATITAICEESTPSRLPGLLASYKAKSLDEIPANEYGRIIAILRKPKK